MTANEKRLIDADAVINRFRIVAQSGGAVTYHVSDICAAIEDEACEESVEAVEVVRCKDCKYKRHNKHHDVILCDHPNGRRHLLNPMDFCSDGERRE